MEMSFGKALSCSVVFALVAPLACGASACSSDDTQAPAPIPPEVRSEVPLRVTRRFPDAEGRGPRFPGCIYASPVAVTEPGGERLLVVPEGGGSVVGIDPKSGETRWSVTLPAPDGQVAMPVSTPALVGRRLVVSYHTRSLASRLHVAEPRLGHRVAVIDLDARALDPAFPVVEIGASLPGRFGPLTFSPRHAMNRSALVHAVPPGATLGRVYVTYGNVRSLQPYRGWIFELDLDAWHAGGEAISAARATTEDVECGPEGGDGARDALCGGGAWSPSGPLLLPADDGGYSLVVPAGNGQLDLARGDYANTLMRLGPGLTFETGCDDTACRAHSMENLVSGCAESCKDLFVPRLMPGEEPPRPASNLCDGKGLYACWVILDQPDGGSSPARVTLPSGRRVLTYPTKDGHVWLVDEEHLGRAHAHEPLTPLCGAPGDACSWDWAGTIVTRPTVTSIGDAPAIVVPTFMPDRTHPAGVVALRVVEKDGTPAFEPAWRFPPPDDRSAVQRFRRHPTRATVAVPPGAEEHTFVVDVAPPHGTGTLFALRTRDGKLGAEVSLEGPGYRFASPLYEAGTLYVTSCDSDFGEGTLEAYDVAAD